MTMTTRTQTGLALTGSKPSVCPGIDSKQRQQSKFFCSGPKRGRQRLEAIGAYETNGR